MDEFYQLATRLRTAVQQYCADSASCANVFARAGAAIRGVRERHERKLQWMLDFLKQRVEDSNKDTATMRALADAYEAAASRITGLIAYFDQQYREYAAHMEELQDRKQENDAQIDTLYYDITAQQAQISRLWGRLFNLYLGDHQTKQEVIQRQVLLPHDETRVYGQIRTQAEIIYEYFSCVLDREK